MKYCRIQTVHGPQFAEVVERNGQLWIERLIPPFEEDTFTCFADQPMDPLPFASANCLPRSSPRNCLCWPELPRIRRRTRQRSTRRAVDPLEGPFRSSRSRGTIRLPSLSQRVDFEGELAIVIGEKCSHIGAEEDVWQFIRGYTIVNDVSARDLQKKDGQWSRAKGFDTFCPAGPR